MERALRATAYTFAGGLMLLVGLGFLTVADWLLLAELRDPLFAFAVIGAGYAGLGLVFLALARRRHTRGVRLEADRKTAQVVLGTQVLEGFLLGLNAGRGAGKGRD